MQRASENLKTAGGNPFRVRVPGPPLIHQLSRGFFRCHNPEPSWVPCSNPAMLAEAAPLESEGGVRLSRVVARAEWLPFAQGGVDALLSFSAVHHFCLDAFLEQAARVLGANGLLIVYTRTPHQNERTVWGQFFPGFAERETRLFTEESLLKALAARPEFEGQPASRGMVGANDCGSFVGTGSRSVLSNVPFLHRRGVRGSPRDLRSTSDSGLPLMALGSTYRTTTRSSSPGRALRPGLNSSKLVYVSFGAPGRISYSKRCASWPDPLP